MLATGLLSFFVLLAGSPTGAQAPPDDPITRLTSDDLARGKLLFDGQCALCHGIGGDGGQGPTLQQSKLPRAAGSEALFSVIRKGIPGTTMPGNWAMSDREIWQVAGYVRSLGETPHRPLAGDPGRGQAIYEGKGGCSVCHIVQGRGGSLGPDLTDVGVRRGPSYLRESLLEPGASGPKGHLVIRVVTRDGHEIRGMRVNEDVFTIQLRDANNRFHSVRKFEVQDLQREAGESLMPSYRGTLSAAEIEDLVAYLAGLRGEL